MRSSFVSILAVLAFAAVPAIAQEGETATADEADLQRSHAQFRHIEPEPPQIDLNKVGTVRFLTDESFPPYSYKTAAGALTGFNVALADAMCRDLRLRCEFVVKPWGQLLKSLAAGEGNAILSGVRITSDSFATLEFTRPFLRPFGKFIVRKRNPIKQAGVKALAGKRVGVVSGSVHEAFIKAYFPRSRILASANIGEAREALRRGKLDALFEDSVQAMFWLTGASSRGCCRFAGAGFRDQVYLDAVLSIAVKRGNGRLRQVLDHGLDRMQTSGQLIRIYRSFFPMDAW